MQLVITETVKNEALVTLPKVVYQYLERAQIQRDIINKLLLPKMKKRLFELLASAKVDNISSNPGQVKSMYYKISKTPEGIKKLRGLRKQKHRSSLFPSLTDMTILAEANSLSRRFKVYLITDDSDYIIFKVEIQTNLQVNVIELLNLNNFCKEL